MLLEENEMRMKQWLLLNMLFQKLVVRKKLEIYVLLLNKGNNKITEHRAMNIRRVIYL